MKNIKKNLFVIDVYIKTKKEKGKGKTAKQKNKKVYVINACFFL